MKKGWEIKKLKDVSLVIAGQSPEGPRDCQRIGARRRADAAGRAC
jgi:hypothetical protein